VTAVLVCTWLLAASGCGTQAPAHPATSAPSAPPLPAASVSRGPCDDVTTTTPIDQVATACQELWSPYGVTEVPPSNELELDRVPSAPAVVNMTGGTVSDATAQHWANASNWDSGWWKWAQGNDQLFMLRHLVGPALISSQEVEALQAGARIEQPECNLYPIRSTLFPMSAQGRDYFTRKGLPADDAYLFVVVYSGPCSETFRYPDGRTANVVDFTTNTTVFTPGVLRHDPVLGDLWFGDAGGTCQDPLGPPPAWCDR
jgi:hypothetical protein